MSQKNVHGRYSPEQQSPLFPVYIQEFKRALHTANLTMFFNVNLLFFFPQLLKYDFLHLLGPTSSSSFSGDDLFLLGHLLETPLWLLGHHTHLVFFPAPLMVEWTLSRLHERAAPPLSPDAEKAHRPVGAEGGRGGQDAGWGCPGRATPCTLLGTKRPRFYSTCTLPRGVIVQIPGPPFSHL